MNALLRAADRYEGRLKTVINRSVLEGRKKISVSRLARALKRRDRAGAERETLMAVNAMTKSLETGLPPVLMSLVVAGAGIATSTLSRDVNNLKAARRTSVKLNFRFDRTNPQAVAWVEKHGAELVTEITDETRRALRRIMTRAFVDGIPPVQAAKQIRKTVGLTSAGEEAVNNLRTKILENPGARIYAGKVPIRVPEKGMSKSRLREVLASYSDRLVRQRSLLIARTETIKASNEGQNQLWKQASQQGLLPRNAKRVWLAAGDERTCPICSELDGKTAPLNGSFEGKFDGPPAHPACRCTTGLA